MHSHYLQRLPEKDLGELTLPSGTVLVQYVDDLLLAAETKEACLQASEALLRTIAEKGYKLKKTKQLVKEQITFLGKVIGGNKERDQRRTQNAIKAEREGVVNGILWQKHQGGRKILAYHSSALEPPERGLPECGKAICAIAKSLDKTAYIVMSHPVIIHTLHGVKAYLDSSDYTITTANRNAKLQRILGNPGNLYHPRSQHD